MYHSDTEMLFPSRAIPTLGKLRDRAWEQLIENLKDLDPTEMDHLAFVLMMVRLGGCTTCQADSYRAMRGCIQCAQQTIRRFKGSDQDLLERFNKARLEMESFIQKENVVQPE